MNVVLNETGARRLFPNEDAIGKRMKRGTSATAPWFTVVGIARDAKLKSPDGDPGNIMYIGMAQSPSLRLAMFVHSKQDPATLALQIEKVVHTFDPDQPIYRVETMEAVVSSAMGQRRFAAQLFILFAVLALGLAAIGVYGLIAQSVLYRRREIGLRMALGADPKTVLRLIVRDGLVLGGLGVVLGLGLALALTRLLASQLFHVSAHDPLVLGLIGPVLLVVAVGASYLPGRSAAKLNPLTALQAD